MGNRNETWRPIPGYEEFYKVSDFGRIKSLGRIRTSGIPLRGKLLKQATVHNGYKQVALCSNGTVKRCLVHRLVLESFIGPCPVGMESCHDPDPSPDNNALVNLRWGTKKENMKDRANHGIWKAARGEMAGRAKRTEKDIEQMFLMRREGATCAFIARHFSAHPSCVSRALRGIEWKHVYERMALRSAS